MNQEIGSFGCVWIQAKAARIDMCSLENKKFFGHPSNWIKNMSFGSFISED